MGNNDGNIDYIVRSSHMEIAIPSIQDGLELLLDFNVDKIICHPYFLSPGKHAMKDIPELISQACQNIQQSDKTNKLLPPIVTTDALGLHVDHMVNIIDNVIQDYIISDDDHDDDDDSINSSMS